MDRRIDAGLSLSVVGFGSQRMHVGFQMVKRTLFGFT